MLFLDGVYVDDGAAQPYACGSYSGKVDRAGRVSRSARRASENHVSNSESSMSTHRRAQNINGSSAAKTSRPSIRRPRSVTGMTPLKADLTRTKVIKPPTESPNRQERIVGGRGFSKLASLAFALTPDTSPQTAPAAPSARGSATAGRRQARSCRPCRTPRAVPARYPCR